MKKLIFCLMLLIAVQAASAKDCPSNLPVNLNQLGDHEFYYGVELRGWAYYVDEYNYLDYDRETETYFFWSAVPMIQFYPSENWMFQMAGLLGDKQDIHCDYADEGLFFRLREAWAEWYSTKFQIRAGRQIFAFGNQLTIDNRFDMAELVFNSRSVDVSVFGGVLAHKTSREAFSCMREQVYERTTCWRKFCNSDWGDFGMAGAALSARLFKDHNQQFMMMWQDANKSHRDAILFSLYLNGKLPFDVRYFEEAVYQKKEESDQFGYSLILQRYFRNKHIANLQFNLGAMYGTANDDEKFSPLYGSQWLGERQRYAVQQGNVLLGEMKLFPKFIKASNVSAAYYLNYLKEESEPYSDELDIGIKTQLSPRYRFWLVYSLLNNVGDLERVHQITLETRLIF